jgi:hypothetical protein
LIYKKKCLLYEVPYPDPNSDWFRPILFLLFSV